MIRCHIIFMFICMRTTFPSSSFFRNYSFPAFIINIYNSCTAISQHGKYFSFGIEIIFHCTMKIQMILSKICKYCRIKFQHVHTSYFECMRTDFHYKILYSSFYAFIYKLYKLKGFRCCIYCLKLFIKYSVSSCSNSCCFIQYIFKNVA